MFTFIVVIIALIAVLISLVILVQSGKGGGLAGIAAGGATQQVLGARQAPDVLEKATWVLATLFIVLCILSNFVIDKGSSEGTDSVIQQRAQQEDVSAPAIPVIPPATESAPAPEGQGGGQEPNNDQ